MNLFAKILFHAYATPLVILGVSFFRKDAAKRKLDFWVAAGFTIYILIGCLMLSRPADQTYDVALRQVDRVLRLDSIVAVSAYPPLRNLLLTAYYALSVMIALAWVLEQDMVMLRSMFIGGWLCFPFYYLIPAVGPGHFDWVNLRPQVGVPDNCVPSMHLTWALLLAWNARSKWLRCALWVYAFPIACATVGLYQHYVIDLIAAIPFTIAVEWMAVHVPLRVRMYFPEVAPK